MSIAITNTLLEKTKDFTIEETFSFLANEYKDKVVFSTSFGQEDQVITALIAKKELLISIFTLDTGRMFQETYDIFHKTIKKYKIDIKSYFPEAAAVEELLKRIDLDALSFDLRHKAHNEGSKQRRTEALKRLNVVEALRGANTRMINRQEWMIMRVLPVIPPELRPLVPLDGGRFATSDLNDLYRRVIIRNNRLKRL